MNLALLSETRANQSKGEKKRRKRKRWGTCGTGMVPAGLHVQQKMPSASGVKASGSTKLPLLWGIYLSSCTILSTWYFDRVQPKSTQPPVMSTGSSNFPQGPHQNSLGVGHVLEMNNNWERVRVPNLASQVKIRFWLLNIENHKPFKHVFGISIFNFYLPKC